MQNGRLFPRAGARCAVATALAASLGIVLAGAVSGCSFDLLKPGAFDIFKQAAASSTVTAPSASALPGAANPSRAANSAATPVAEAQTDEPPP
ncbi:MAG: hypothetical protein WB498_17840, partial [Candidatus Binatus sp.]